MQEGMQAAMPILTKYLSEWQEKVKQELKPGVRVPIHPVGETTPPAQN
jgi:hypothetical protein